MLVLCGVWAIWWWRLSVWNANVNGLRTGIHDLPTVDEWKNVARGLDLDRVRQAQIDRGTPNHVPMSMLVRGVAPASNGRRIVLAQWNGFVASGSLCMAADMYVCSPEFCYLQVCADVRRIIPESVDAAFYLVILVELGCELCGIYSRRNTAKGFITRNAPLVSTGGLLFFLGRMTNSYGSNRFREALLWIADGLASPMETDTYLLLCFSPRLGGLGFARPLVNYRMNVPSEFARRAQRQTVIPDFYWPEANLVAEYDSDDNHRGREREDSERRELLQDMGYIVVVFHSDDLLDRNKFNQKAASLAAHLGHTLPSGPEFETKQQYLHNMLLHHPRWI